MSDPAPGPHDGVLAPGALGEDSLERYLDLGPFLNTSYHVVQVGRGGRAGGRAAGPRYAVAVCAYAAAMHTGPRHLHLALLPSTARQRSFRSLQAQWTTHAARSC